MNKFVSKTVCHFWHNIANRAIIINWNRQYYCTGQSLIFMSFNLPPRTDQSEKVGDGLLVGILLEHKHDRLDKPRAQDLVPERHEICNKQQLSVILLFRLMLQ